MGYLIFSFSSSSVNPLNTDRRNGTMKLHCRGLRISFQCRSRCAATCCQQMASHLLCGSTFLQQTDFLLQWPSFIFTSLKIYVLLSSQSQASIKGHEGWKKQQYLDEIDWYTYTPEVYSAIQKHKKITIMQDLKIKMTQIIHNNDNRFCCICLDYCDFFFQSGGFSAVSDCPDLMLTWSYYYVLRLLISVQIVEDIASRNDASQKQDNKTFSRALVWRVGTQPY